MVKSRLLIALLSLLLSLTSVNLFADWRVDNEQSVVSFTSVKQTNVVEAHHFNHLAGTLSDDGKFILTIDLASVDTDIALRDQRMKINLFEEYKYANATFSTNITPATLTKLGVNKTTSMTLTGQLELHGQTQSIKLLLSVTKLSDSSILVASEKPVMLYAKDFSLMNGIEKLRQMAGLSSIATTVPVSFVIRLTP